MDYCWLPSEDTLTLYSFYGAAKLFSRDIFEIFIPWFNLRISNAPASGRGSLFEGYNSKNLLYTGKFIFEVFSETYEAGFHKAGFFGD